MIYGRIIRGSRPRVHISVKHPLLDLLDPIVFWYDRSDWLLRTLINSIVEVPWAFVALSHIHIHLCSALTLCFGCLAVWLDNVKDVGWAHPTSQTVDFGFPFMILEDVLRSLHSHETALDSMVSPMSIFALKRVHVRHTLRAKQCLHIRIVLDFLASLLVNYVTTSILF